MNDLDRISASPTSELIGYSPVYRLDLPDPEPPMRPSKNPQVSSMGLDSLGAFLIVGLIWSGVLILGVHQVTREFYAGDRYDKLNQAHQASQDSLKDSERIIQDAREVLGCK